MRLNPIVGPTAETLREALPSSSTHQRTPNGNPVSPNRTRVVLGGGVGGGADELFEPEEFPPEELPDDTGAKPIGTVAFRPATATVPDTGAAVKPLGAPMTNG